LRFTKEGEISVMDDEGESLRDGKKLEGKIIWLVGSAT
jgi:hypothetical protein